MEFVELYLMYTATLSQTEAVLSLVSGGATWSACS